MVTNKQSLIKQKGSGFYSQPCGNPSLVNFLYFSQPVYHLVQKSYKRFKPISKTVFSLSQTVKKIPKGQHTYQQTITGIWFGKRPNRFYVRFYTPVYPEVSVEVFNPQYSVTNLKLISKSSFRLVNPVSTTCGSGSGSKSLGV